MLCCTYNSSALLPSHHATGMCDCKVYHDRAIVPYNHTLTQLYNRKGTRPACYKCASKVMWSKILPAFFRQQLPSQASCNPLPSVLTCPFTTLPMIFAHALLASCHCIHALCGVRSAETLGIKTHQSQGLMTNGKRDDKTLRELLQSAGLVKPIPPPCSALKFEV